MSTVWGKLRIVENDLAARGLWRGGQSHSVAHLINGLIPQRIRFPIHTSGNDKENFDFISHPLA